MFTHQHSRFDGIHHLYTDEILPQLFPLETKRKQFWARFWPVTICIVLAVLALSFYVAKVYANGAIVTCVIVLGAIAIGAYYRVGSGKVSRNTKSILMGEICRFLSLSYTMTGLDGGAAFKARLQGLRLLPKRIDRSHFEDTITGELDGVGIQVCEAQFDKKVQTKDGSKWVSVFRGSLIEMDFHREFLGTTIVLRDGGLFNSKRKGEMKRIGLGEPRFEKIFEAYGTDQVEGRYLLTPVFMEKLVALEGSVDGKKIRFAFAEGRLLIVVEHRNRFETTNLRRPLTDSSRVQTVIDELEAIFSIVSAVSAPQKRAYS